VTKYRFIKKVITKVAALGMLLSTSALAGVSASSYSPHKYQQNDWFGEFGEFNSMYVNAGGLVENDQFEASLGIFRTISGEAGQEFFAMTMPYDYKHSYSFAWFENGADIDGGPSYTEHAFMFGYAYRVMHSVAIGVDLALLYINQFEYNKQVTPGLDVGVSWNPIANSKVGFLQLGASVQNLLQPQISTAPKGGSSSFVTIGTADAYSVPMNLNFSAFYRGLNRMLELKAELAMIDLLPEEDSKASFTDKIETSFTTTYYLSPLLGIRLRLTKEGYPVLGATVNVKHVNMFRYIELDLEMSHDKLMADKNRGFLWSTKVSTRLGPTREESIGYARYRRLKIEPENDYRRAMLLYLKRDFLGAAYAFGKVITKYPSFHLVDQAAFYKGKSFENMRMHKASRKVYQVAIKKYPLSDQQAKYHFQLMNIDYKEGKFSEALIKYEEIARKYADTDVKADADYIVGQIKFEQKQYQAAVDLLSPILPGNANYLYARFTIGIAFTRIEEREKAEASFNDIINYQAASQSEEDLQNAAKVKLGHLYFSTEPPRFAEAATLYKSIPNESHVKAEALLALAWSLLKVNQLDKALDIGKYVIDRFPKSFLVSEAYLVEGYVYFIKKDWTNAKKSLEACKALVEKPLVSEEEKLKERAEYEGMISDFESIQMGALDLARQLPTPRVQQKRNALKPKFDKANSAIDDHYQFLNKALQSDRFDGNRKRLLDDASFTLAEVVSRMGGASDIGDDLDGLDEEL
jgi:tetratricopeptide (TPR) repeat protein